MKKILRVIQQNQAHCTNEDILLSTLDQDEFLGRFFRLATINILSNLTVPLAGLISVAFLGHLIEIRHLAGSHMLWLAMSLFMAAKVVTLGTCVPRTLRSLET